MLLRFRALFSSLNRTASRLFKLRMSHSGLQHVVWSSEETVAYLSPQPWTPGAVVVEQRPPGAVGRGLFDLEEQPYMSLLLKTRAVALLLCERLGVHRCALVSRPHSDRPPQIHLLPLHGLDAEWRPHLAADEEYNADDPGYCTSKSAPRWSNERLTELQMQIRVMLPDPQSPPDLSYLGKDPADPRLFPRIVRGEELHWRLWEDPGHVAFLTPFPNTPGFSVLVPRTPLSSDIFSLKKQDYISLVKAAREVALLLQRGLGAGGVGLIFEGFEIDYAHAKLIPLPSSSTSETGRIRPRAVETYSTYPGFVSSEDGPEASADSLQQIHSLLTCSCSL